jgi:hypothetical protein
MGGGRERGKRMNKLDKIIFLLECLVQNRSFGAALKYPDGEPLQVADPAEALRERVTAWDKIDQRQRNQAISPPFAK